MNLVGTLEYWICFFYFSFFKGITAVYFIRTVAIVAQNHWTIIILQMGDERVVLAVQFFLLQGLTIIIFLTMPFLVILLHIAPTFLMAVSCREPINILCPRESFFPPLLGFPPSVFVTQLASGQSHTN